MFLSGEGGESFFSFLLFCLQGVLKMFASPKTRHLQALSILRRPSAAWCVEDLLKQPMPEDAESFFAQAREGSGSE